MHFLYHTQYTHVWILLPCICNGYNQITVISVNSITVSLSTLQFANGFDKFDMFIDGAVKTTNFFLVKLAKTMDTHVTRSFFSSSLLNVNKSCCFTHQIIVYILVLVTIRNRQKYAIEHRGTFTFFKRNLPGGSHQHNKKR